MFSVTLHLLLTLPAPHNEEDCLKSWLVCWLIFIISVLKSVRNKYMYVSCDSFTIRATVCSAAAFGNLNQEIEQTTVRLFIR